MRLLQSVLWIGALLALASAPVHADIWVQPLPGGNNQSGDGSENNPYATISFAYSQAAVQGETIRAKPGEYFDVVNAFGQLVEVSEGVFEEKWVNIVADNPSPGVTKIMNSSLTSVTLSASSRNS